MKLSNFTLAVLLVLTGPLVHAQDVWTEIDDDSLVIEQLGMTVEEMDNASIYASDGERIGELDDILMSKEVGTMAISIDVGGFLGIGEKDVVIPLESLSRVANGDLVVDMTREQLEMLPEFEG